MVWVLLHFQTFYNDYVVLFYMIIYFTIGIRRRKMFFKKNELKPLNGSNVPGIVIVGQCLNSPTFYFILFYLFIFRESRRRKRGRETSMCGCSSCTPYWGPGLQPSMCPDWESNLQPFGSQPTLNPLSYTRQGQKPFFNVMAI